VIIAQEHERFSILLLTASDRVRGPDKQVGIFTNPAMSTIPFGRTPEENEKSSTHSIE